jgi:hypothetical protein
MDDRGRAEGLLYILTHHERGVVLVLEDDARIGGRCRHRGRH